MTIADMLEYAEMYYHRALAAERAGEREAAQGEVQCASAWMDMAKRRVNDGGS